MGARPSTMSKRNPESTPAALSRSNCIPVRHWKCGSKIYPYEKSEREYYYPARHPAFRLRLGLFESASVTRTAKAVGRSVHAWRRLGRAAAKGDCPVDAFGAEAARGRRDAERQCRGEL